MQPALQFLLKNQALKYPNFRRYLTLRFFIILALNMQLTIIYWWVYHLTNDVSLVGVLGLCEAIPAIGCSLISGHYVEQREKKSVLAGSVVLYILLAIGLALLSLPVLSGRLSLSWIVRLIYVAVFISGILRAFISPASFALMGLLIPRKHYSSGTTWSSASWQIGFVVGRLLGGVMLVLGISTSLFAVLAFEFVAFAAIATIPKQQIHQKEKEPILKSLKEGLGFVFKTQLILASLSLDMFAVLFGGAVALLPVYAKDILHVGAIGYGWLNAAPGIGSVLTLFILSFVPLKKNPGYKLLACLAGFGIVTILFGISTNFALSLAMLTLGGMFDAVSVVIRGTILQLYTPDKMRGRVAAVNTMFISSSNELGAVESGYTAKWMGTVPAVVFGGCMTLVVVGVTWFAAPMLRKLKLNAAELPEHKT